MVFIGLQCMSYFGLVEIKWLEVEKKAMALIDTDGDGKITATDVKRYWKRIIKVLTHQLPSTAGFSVGMLVGFKQGIYNYLFMLFSNSLHSLSHFNSLFGPRLSSVMYIYILLFSVLLNK